MENKVYFSDQFFSAGMTDIYNESQEKIGTLDHMSMFTSGIRIEGVHRTTGIEAGFGFFSNKWTIKRGEEELGYVKNAFSFFTKKYRYFKDGLEYEIESPAFSKEYTVLNESREEVVFFRKVSGFFQTAAYELVNHSELFEADELIAVIMGVNAIEKRNRSAGSGGGAAGGS
ncbi:hypothetical protein JMA_35020 [Jeotgalibacillus malaysiensis]|uniref:Uncharacterized protein n=1 Tax=Jeotgalibacillus malaysiensis TaxID=1508404 RepID=A0A0B5AXV4_9BACL|nr:hypothetical protein [Jeotgalibacillus malaysiensis]AJD92819.1 hypothetical protein JMA_35020 [Jeotgalibacillus malaysiensis]